jgi:ribosomal protein S18 acetylase RimI-like enzyme
MLSASHPTTAEFTEAAEANLNEKSLGFGRLAGGEIHRGNPEWFITNLRGVGYNGVVKADFPTNRLDDCIEDTLQPFLAAGLPLTWWTGPSTRPLNLGARLQIHGLVHNRDMIGMSAAIEALKSPYETLPELRIEEVSDQQTLAEWHPLYMKGFNMPQSLARDSLDTMSKMAFMPGSGWKHYYVRTGKSITAVGSIFIHDQVAGLYNLVTDPQERGQGIGAAMTLGLFAIAREQGCRIATLQTTYPNALRLYHRLGFEVYCKFGIYQLLSHSV